MLRFFNLGHSWQKVAIPAFYTFSK